jgi:hypothetical protein
MEEIKLSPKERDLLLALYQSDSYNNGLKPFLERVGNGISRATSEQAQDWDSVLVNRGKLQMLKWIHSQLKAIDDKERKSS